MSFASLKKSRWLIPAIVFSIVVNAALLGLMTFLISERGLPETFDDLGAISLITMPPPELLQEDKPQEPEPPKPKQQLDFKPDLVRPDLMKASDLDVGVSFSLAGMEGQSVESEFVFEAFELDEPPKPISRVPPVYPFGAREQGIEGIVQVKLLIHKDGSVGEVVIIDARPQGIFEDAVRRSVPRWMFSPGTIQGKAVTAWVVTALRFELH